MHHILEVSYCEENSRVYSKTAQENLNIFRKLGVWIHKNYLKDKKQTVKTNMINCLLNDNYLLEILQFLQQSMEFSWERLHKIDFSLEIW